MEVVYQRCAGVDVHLRFLVVCLSIVEGGQRRNETADLFALREWLVQEKCDVKLHKRIAPESDEAPKEPATRFSLRNTGSPC
jgi:hypothetical protein